MNKVDLAKIKQRRMEMRINQLEMARELGFLNASTYCKYEKGQYQLDANHIPVIAKKLKLKVSEIFLSA